MKKERKGTAEPTKARPKALRRPSAKASLDEQYAYWDQRLKKEGFEDAEDRATGKLKTWSGIASNRGDREAPDPPRARFGRESSVVRKNAAAEYYRLAGQFLHEHEFRTPLEQKVWALHCEGKGRHEIARTLRTRQWKAREIVAKLSREMLEQKVGRRSNVVQLYRHPHQGRS